MKRLISVAAILLTSASAQDWDPTGIWQGTLDVGRELRLEFKVSKDGDGGLKCTLYLIDQGGAAVAATVTRQTSGLKMALPGAAAVYEGKMDAGGNSLTGTWTQGGGKPLPLNLKRVNADEAWPIPAASATKPMAKDAHLVLEVATIKPSNAGTQGKGITMRGPREVVTFNTSMNDLISFAYAVHPRQITGAPAWFDTELYDVTGTPEAEGLPNRKQLEAMLQNLLTDRFKLTFHHDKKELSVYAITVAKGGPKLMKSAGDPNGLPGLGFRALGNMNAVNSNMSDLAGLFQSIVLDRPVIDQTELSGRYDFQLKWTPDASQFNGRGGSVPASSAAEAPPDLFTAIQEQLGLQLKAEKAPVDVMVIDRVEKPTAN